MCPQERVVFSKHSDRLQLRLLGDVKRGVMSTSNKGNVNLHPKGKLMRAVQLLQGEKHWDGKLGKTRLLDLTLVTNKLCDFACGE